MANPARTGGQVILGDPVRCHSPPYATITLLLAPLSPESAAETPLRLFRPLCLVLPPVPSALPCAASSVLPALPCVALPGAVRFVAAVNPFIIETTGCTPFLLPAGP
jgi:hypothetical protein